jgi:hypothetical protein
MAHGRSRPPEIWLSSPSGVRIGQHEERVLVISRAADAPPTSADRRRGLHDFMTPCDRNAMFGRVESEILLVSCPAADG